MSYPYMHTALARERQNTLLEEAHAAHRAKEARAERRARDTRGVHRGLFRRIPGRLVAAGSRLLTAQPRSSTEASG